MLARVLFALYIISLTAHGEVISDNSDKNLTMCVSHYPPYQIILPGQTPIGENIATTTYFFKQQGYTVNFTQNNTFWRCLAMLKTGKADLMSGLLDAPERRKVADLLVYGALKKKIFYVNKDYTHIKSFSDLKGLKVAVLRDVKQFKQFDNAPDDYLEKIYVNDLDTAFRILAAGKVDMFISTDNFYLEKYKTQVIANKDIEEITIDLQDSSLLFTAISKKSKISHLAAKFKALSKKSYENGEFQQIINDFKLKHPEYYP